MPALYDDTPGHTQTSHDPRFHSAFWSPSCSREMAGGPWMADAHEERALHDLCDAHGLTRLARRGAAKGHFFSLKTDFVADFS